MKYVPPINGDVGDPERSYVNANLSIGLQGSIPPAQGVEHPQREIVNAIIAAGLVPDENDLTQLTQAIMALASPIDSLPIGTEIMWSSSIIPPKFLEQNGATFSAITYPDLAVHLGGTTLPDLRGEFIRGWDHGRGIDAGRVLGSSQSDSFKSHTHTMTLTSFVGDDPTGGGQQGWGGDNMSKGSRTNTTSSSGDIETRPRNVAKIFLIKAL